jgi:Amt family ammonium transporter
MGSVDSGDTAFVIVASALVLFMRLPGLALFYGGLVRARNLLSVLMQCFAIAAMVSVLWFAAGYSLTFSGAGPLVGDLSTAGLVTLADVREGLTIPENVFALYQMTFAIITPALIIGAFPERVRFGWVMIFSALWLAFVYIPVAHWIWGGGWLAGLGVRDFAGGIVVHTTAGISALVLALMIGPRRGFPQQSLLPHSPALTVMGAGMLWVGWFGFNGGSALAANASAGGALLATHLAASTAACAWMILEWSKFGKATSVGMVTGAIAGLATITPAAGFVSPLASVVIGAVGATVCFWAVSTVKQRLKIDDSLDVFAVHGIGGMTGSMLLAIFSPQPGMGEALGAQAIGVGVTAIWSAIATFVLAKLAGVVIAMRVDPEAENEGLDVTSHGERAYELD